VSKPWHLPIELNAVVLGLALILWLRWGEGDFSKCKPKGPFRVGHQTIYIKDKLNAVSVFFPVDVKDYEENPQPNKMWLDHPDEWINGLNDARLWYDQLKSKPSSFMFKHWKSI